MDIELLLITLMPSILILLYIIYSDKFVEPISVILVTCLLGVIIIIPAGFLNEYLIPKETKYNFLAGFTEEPLKFLVLLFYVYRNKYFDEPMDGIVYGVCVSLGFATMENFQYVFNPQYAEMSYAIAGIRAISAIPMHAMCGVLMGYYLGMHAFKRKNYEYLILSLIIPIFFHAFYNFLVDYGYWYLLLLIVMFIYSYKLHKTLKNMQDLKKVERENKSG